MPASPPERCALLARLLLEHRSTRAAADALDRCSHYRDRVLDEPRLAVAEALVEDAPNRAITLVGPLASKTGPLQPRALRILEAARLKRTKR